MPTDEQVSKEDEMKQVTKDAIKELLREQIDQFQHDFGRLVLRWLCIFLALAIFHMAFHGKYQKLAEYVVSIGQ
jgi:hypothetical protein